MTDYTDPFDPVADQPAGDSSLDLSAYDAEFDAAQAMKMEEVPDGKYQIRINSVKLAESQKGDPMIKWDLIVISGQFAERHIFKNSVITPASLPFVKGDLNTLGLNLTKFSDLPNHLESLLDLNVEVTKRTKGEYTNVYFNKVIQIAASIADRF